MSRFADAVRQRVTMTGNSRSCAHLWRRDGAGEELDEIPRFDDDERVVRLARRADGHAALNLREAASAAAAGTMKSPGGGGRGGGTRGEQASTLPHQVELAGYTVLLQSRGDAAPHLSQVLLCGGNAEDLV